MNYLVLCPCSHTVDRHSDRGCAGTAEHTCSCPLNAFDALEEAVNDARSLYSRSPADDGASHGSQRGG